MRSSVLLLSWLVSAGAPDALADPDSIQFLSVGVIGSGSVGRSSMAGIGVEATLSSLDVSDRGYGVYIQAETGGRLADESSSIGDQRRYAAGAMLLRGWLGVELGGLYRTAPMLEPTPGVQLGLFASAGLVSLELRAGLASAGSAEHPRYGSDIGLVIAAKLPVQIGGEALSVKNVSLLPCVWWCHRK